MLMLTKAERAGADICVWTTRPLLTDGWTNEWIDGERNGTTKSLFGPVSTCDKRVLKEPLGRAVCSCARAAHCSLALQRYTLLTLPALFIHGLPHSLCSLVHAVNVFNENSFVCCRR